MLLAAIAGLSGVVPHTPGVVVLAAQATEGSRWSRGCCHRPDHARDKHVPTELG